MTEALRLASAAQGHVWPNPPVGCVIVRDGAIVGCGQTQPGGRPHAERVALAQAAAQAWGATLYVTLEPCCHWGRTPPCADAIIAAGVRRVVCAIRDPDPRVDGRGFAALSRANIKVDVGLAAGEASRVVRGFLHRVRTGEPLVIAGTPVAPYHVPDGIDAALWREGSQLRLTLRQGRAAIRTEAVEAAMQPAALLSALGRRGLTTLYVGRGDEMAAYATGAED